MKPTTMTRARATQLLTAFTVLVVVGLAFALRPQPAHAAADGLRMNLRAQAEIFTDTLEGPTGNNSFDAAKQVIIWPTCDGAQLLQNLTLPQGDYDYYSVQATSKTTITLRIEAMDSLNPATPKIQPVLFLYGQNRVLIQQQFSSGEGNPVELVWFTDSSAQFYFQVASSDATQGEFKPYRIKACISGSMGSATATPIPGSASDDVYEPNNSPHDVLNPTAGVIRSFLNVGSTFANSQQPNFFSTAPLGSIQVSGDVDWYFFYGRNGGRYRITTSAQPGVDTELYLFRNSAALTDKDFKNWDGTGQMAYSDDYQAGDRGSRIDFTGDYDGPYWIKVWNKDPGPRSGNPGYNPSYNVAVQEIVLPITGTATPGPTPYPQGADRCEYNGDWDSAVLIAPNMKYDNLNFVPFMPPSRDTVDNDFFRMPVKQGVYYTCETLDLGGGADTNLIVYNQNALQNRDAALIGGNDNISLDEAARGNFASRLSWLSGYTGIAYLLLGDVTPPRAYEAEARTYSLQCTIGLPTPPTATPDPNPSATPAPAEPFVPPTAEPPDPTMTPFPTPKAAQNLVVRPIDAVPTAAATPTEAPRLATMTVFVFVDRNKNGATDPREGVENIAVRITDDKGTPLRWLRTNADGRALFFEVHVTGPLRVSIPYFGYNAVIDDPNQIVNVALTGEMELPQNLP